MPSWGLLQHIETKSQTTCFYLVEIFFKKQKGQFHIKSSRAWHPYLSEFLHFRTICRYHWYIKTLKISAANSLWFLRYRYLKIWAKYLIRTKICHFEFTLSLITSGLKDLSSWNLVHVSFFGMRSPKFTLRIHKKPVFSHFTFLSFRYAWPEVGLERYVTLHLFKINLFPSESKDINQTFCQNWGWVLF